MDRRQQQSQLNRSAMQQQGINDRLQQQDMLKTFLFANSPQQAAEKRRDEMYQQRQSEDAATVGSFLEQGDEDFAPEYRNQANFLKQWAVRNPPNDVAPRIKLFLQQAKMHPTPASAADKLGQTQVGLLKGLNVVDPNTGLPWSIPTDSYNEAIKKGGVPISDKAKEALNLNRSADQDLDNLLSAGQGVLPGADASGLSKALAPYSVAAKSTFGDVNAASFQAAKIGMITHLRAVANASRVNAQELKQVNDALINAHSYPQLQAAVAQAKDLLAKSRQYFLKAGRLSGSVGASGPTISGPGGGASANPRQPVYLNGKLIGYTTDGKTMEPVP
jgi:hypothetical protein